LKIEKLLLELLSTARSPTGEDLEKDFQEVRKSESSEEILSNSIKLIYFYANLVKPLL
jgi:hypothetical protein